MFRPKILKPSAKKIWDFGRNFQNVRPNKDFSQTHKNQTFLLPTRYGMVRYIPLAPPPAKFRLHSPPSTLTVDLCRSHHPRLISVRFWVLRPGHGNCSAQKTPKSGQKFRQKFCQKKKTIWLVFYESGASWGCWSMISAHVFGDGGGSRVWILP